MRPRSAPRSAPRPEIAFWFSVIVPGLGQIYAGAPVRGVVFAALVWLGLGGILNSEFFTSPRPWYPLYGALGALVMLASWCLSAWHARRLALRWKNWPPLYRFLGRPAVRECLGAAKAELSMVLLFVVALVLYGMEVEPPAWLPSPPRFWFLYEVFVALYLAVFHGIVELRSGGRALEEARTAGFFAITVLATLSIGLLGKVPAAVLLFAYLLALPSCWFSLRHRSAEPTRRQVARLVMTLLLGFFALFAYGVLLEIWEQLSGVRQYEMRLVRDDALAGAVVGLFYYLLRAGFEMIAHRIAACESPSIVLAGAID
jgi:hypothetical protein